MCAIACALVCGWGCVCVCARGCVRVRVCVCDWILNEQVGGQGAAKSGPGPGVEVRKDAQEDVRQHGLQLLD